MRLRIRRFWRAAFPWLMGLATIALFVGVLATSAVFQACIANAPPKSGQENFIESVAEFFIFARGCTGTFVHDNADAIIAGFTVILALSTIALWSATRGLVRGAEDTSNRELRAYVFPDSAGLFDRGRPRKARRTKAEIEMAGCLGSFMAIKNSGKTPAYKVVHWANIVICKPEEEESMLIVPHNVAKFNGATLAPGGMLSKNVWRQEVVTPEERAAIIAATKLIYLYGRIEYVDISGRVRFTNYRLSFGGSYPPYQDILLLFREGGNDSDQNSD